MQSSKSLVSQKVTQVHEVPLAGASVVRVIGSLLCLAHAGLVVLYFLAIAENTLSEIGLALITSKDLIRRIGRYNQTINQ